MNGRVGERTAPCVFTPSGGPSAPGRRGLYKAFFSLLAAVLIRCCRWQKGLTVSQRARLPCSLESLPLIKANLASRRAAVPSFARIVVAAMLRAGDEHSDPARLSAGEEHCLMAFLRSVSECCVRLSFQHCTPAADERAERYGAGARHRANMFVDASL